MPHSRSAKARTNSAARAMAILRDGEPHSLVIKGIGSFLWSTRSVPALYVTHARGTIIVARQPLNCSIRGKDLGHVRRRFGEPAGQALAAGCARAPRRLLGRSRRPAPLV